MTDATDQDIAGVAHHEAGHAAIGRHLGRRVVRVSIDPATLDGNTEFGEGEFDAMRELVIALAGGVAQAKFDVDTIRDPEGQKPGTLISDMAKVMELVESMAPDDEAEQDRLRRVGEVRTTQLVGREDLWLAIGKLAQALVARQVLSAEEVEFLLQ